MSVRRFGSAIALMALAVLARDGQTAGFAATVSDAELVVRGVQRTLGRQSAVVHFTVAPAPATRTRVAGTLTVGATVLPVDVLVGRNGRASVRAFRVSLPDLPDFGSARLDVPVPVDASLEFAAAACVPHARGHVLACAASVPAPERAPDGVYDADVVAGANQVPIAPALASVTTRSDGSRGIGILLSMYDGLQLGGPSDGSTAVLTGYSITGGDIIATASGTATSSHDATGSRLDGHAESAPFGSTSTWQFTLRRPDAGTPSVLGGTWRVTFAGGGLGPFTGDATLVVTVAADGHATTAATAVVADGGTVHPLDAGTCLVAPAGALSCRLPSPDMYGVQMHGALDAAGGSGSGQFYLGSPPSIFASGGWTAVRMP